MPEQNTPENRMESRIGGYMTFKSIDEAKAAKRERRAAEKARLSVKSATDEVCGLKDQVTTIR